MGIFRNAKQDMVTMQMEGTRNVTATGVVRVIVEGKDWGPATTKAIIEFNDDPLSADSFNKTYFTVNEVINNKKTERVVLDAYPSDHYGNRSDQPSKFVCLDLFVSPTVGSPSFFNPATISADWHTDFGMEITLNHPIEVNEHHIMTKLVLNKKIDMTNKHQRITPEVNQFRFEENEEYGYAYYKPKKRKESYPLVIWLHGGGEGGDDLYKCILGNKVVALIKEDFQKLFDGAYVLVPQCKTFWMDGYGTFDAQLRFTPSNRNSYYTESLMALIEDFVSKHPIDRNQIIVGGCSNGGYMALQLVVDYPDYFSAAYPICQGMLDSSLTDRQINAVADSGTGIYFIYSKDDPVFDHLQKTTVPTYMRLRRAGARVHQSVFEEITEVYPGLDEDILQKYSGHFSWVKFFNNECDGLWEMLSQERKG